MNILSSAVCSLDQSKADICCRVIGIVARKCTNVPKGVSDNLLKVLDENIMLLVCTYVYTSAKFTIIFCNVFVVILLMLLISTHD